MLDRVRVRRHTVPRRQRRLPLLVRAGTYALLFTAGPVLVGIGTRVDLAPRDAAPVLARVAPEPASPASESVVRSEAGPEPVVIRGVILSPHRDRRQVAERTRRAVRAERRVLADLGTVPGRAVSAYRRAARTAPCTIDWTLVAAIGLVETDHGRYGGAHLTPSGLAVPEIRGPALTGSDGFAYIADSDDGRVDGDTVHDRAVGPMQFIPGTWKWAGTDGDGNGTRDPHDIDDAAAAAAGYLCRGGDLTSDSGRRAAVLTYNQSQAYADAVLGVAASYAAGHYTAVAVMASPEDEPEKRPKKRKHRKHPGKTDGRQDRTRPERGTPRAPETDGSATPSPSPRPTPRPTPRPSPAPTPRPTPTPSETPTPSPGEQTPTPGTEPGA